MADLTEKERAAVVGLELLEAVRRAEDQADRARAARDTWMQQNHGTFSYAELVKLTDPNRNGGRATKKMSRSRVIQVVQEGKP